MGWRFQANQVSCAMYYGIWDFSLLFCSHSESYPDVRNSYGGQ
jgi:hypothetical protein